jgi:hypothetical protein
MRRYGACAIEGGSGCCVHFEVVTNALVHQVGLCFGHPGVDITLAIRAIVAHRLASRSDGPVAVHPNPEHAQSLERHS